MFIGFLGLNDLQNIFALEILEANWNFWKEKGFNDFKNVFALKVLGVNQVSKEGQGWMLSKAYFYIRDFRGKSSFRRGKSKANGLFKKLILCLVVPM
jgi:hypothetical protein